jgi:hypothetical protein
MSSVVIGSVCAKSTGHDSTFWSQVMQMVNCNPQSPFQCLMTAIFHDCIDGFIHVYMDDIFICWVHTCTRAYFNPNIFLSLFCFEFSSRRPTHSFYDSQNFSAIFLCVKQCILSVVFMSHISGVYYIIPRE